MRPTTCRCPGRAAVRLENWLAGGRSCAQGSGAKPILRAETLYELLKYSDQSVGIVQTQCTGSFVQITTLLRSEPDMERVSTPTSFHSIQLRARVQVYQTEKKGGQVNSTCSVLCWIVTLFTTCHDHTVLHRICVSGGKSTMRTTSNRTVASSVEATRQV